MLKKKYSRGTKLHGVDYLMFTKNSLVSFWWAIYGL